MTLARGLGILRLLSQAGPAGLGIAEICKREGLNRVTAHRIVAGLVRERWLEQDGERRYRLGVQAWQVGRAAQTQFDLISVGDPSLDVIERNTHDTVFLLRRIGDEALCIARREGSYPVKLLVMDVGVSYPLGVGAATLAILAHLAEADFEAALASTAAKLKGFPRLTVATIRRMAKETRTRGFAFSSGFIVPEACAVAVPIFDGTGAPMGSFACAASPARMQGDQLDLVVETLRREANRVSERLGARPQDRPRPKRKNLTLEASRLDHV